MGHKFSFCKDCETPLDCDFCDKLEMLEEKKHGYWKIATRYWVCSECGYATTGAQTTKPDKLPYCPLCGAKMDKEES